jgi:lysine 2,3-aminomutase
VNAGRSAAKREVLKVRTSPQIKIGREAWEGILSRSITSAPDLSSHFEVDVAAIGEIVTKYPMRINPYYLGLIRAEGDPIYSQCVPDIREITDTRGYEDPLHEEKLSPVPGLTHKYPDRVLFLISNQCAAYCRFCNRKRKVGSPSVVTKETIKEGFAYIRKTPKVRDVLLSGGDPLLLPDEKLHQILGELRSISHVEIIRIGTRVPCTLPQRITPELADLLKRFHPLYISTHFNHPREITPEAALACMRLADAGIPLGCQTVLLKGVNDNAETLRRLMRKLLLIRVQPYYLFQADLARGTAHFWTNLKKALEIMGGVQEHIPGTGMPHFVVDLPEGGGKVPLLPVQGGRNT